MKRKKRKSLLIECAVCNSTNIQIKGTVKYYLHTICLSCGLNSADMIMNHMNNENSNNVQIIKRQNIPRHQNNRINNFYINYTKH